MQAIIRMGAAGGVGRARLALSPADLGGIEIRLRTSAAGVIAQVVADSPHAAQLLQQAGDDLRRSLDAQGLHLLRLDVDVAGEERAGHGAGEAADDTTRGAAGDDHGDAAGQDDASTDPGETTIALPNGVLVDVLA